MVLSQRLGAQTFSKDKNKIMKKDIRKEKLRLIFKENDQGIKQYRIKREAYNQKLKQQYQKSMGQETVFPSGSQSKISCTNIQFSRNGEFLLVITCKNDVFVYCVGDFTIISSFNIDTIKSKTNEQCEVFSKISVCDI